MFAERLYGTESTHGEKVYMHMKARRNWRWLVLVGSVLAFAGLSPFLTAASGAGGGSAAKTGPIAPTAVLTSGPARIVSGNTRIATPARPAGVAINRPSIPMAQYRTMKQAGAKAGGAKPSQSAAPLSSNQIIGQAPLTSQGGAGGSWIPPDINGAVGDTQVTQIVNSKISVWTKNPSAPVLVSEISLNTRFFYSAASLFDPRIEYDARWNRWVAITDAFPEANGVQHFLLGISSTSNAAGGWVVYNFVLPIAAGGFVDYPQLGLSQDAVIITYSDFAAAQRCLTFGVAKAIVYNAQSFSTPVFSLGNNCTATPPNVIDQNPRAHELRWIPGVGAANVEYRNPQTGFYSAINAITPLGGILSTTPPPDAQQPAAPACTAPSCDIDTSDGRFVNDPTQYGDDLWSVHTPGFGAFPIPAWYDFDTEGAGANTAKQSNFIFVSPDSFDWNASIAAQQDGRAYLQWTYTDPPSGVYPSMAFTGRLGADPASTLNAPTVVFNSAFKMMGNYDPRFGAQRWGDTSSIRFDPSIFDRAYALNETVPDSSFWGTRQAAVRVVP
jgi:hypothetical protein